MNEENINKQSEEEFNKLIKDYNQSQKEYISKINRKFSSCVANTEAPLLPKINSKMVYISSDKCAKKISRRIAQTPIDKYTNNKTNKEYGNNVYIQEYDSYIKKYKNIISDYHKQNSGIENSFIFVNNRNKFPRKIFSFGNRLKKPLF